MSREVARWQYTEGSGGAAGCVEYADGKLHVHNDTSPARGNHHAFDLTRIHKFGHLDKDCAIDVAMAERPSYKAMIEFAQKELTPARAAAELADLGDAAPPANDDSWLDIGTTVPAKVEPPSPFRVIEAGEFAGGAYVQPDWLIEELIPAHGIGLAWGLSGSDKTGGIFDLAASTHRGVPWRDKAVKRGRSVIVVAEGEYFFANRLRAYAKDRGIAVSELPAVVPCAINLRDSKQVATFALELKKLGVAQVWFDTLQQCSPGADENSVRDMGEVITNLKFLSRSLGCFAGVVHHAGKQVDKGARGSSAWRPAVDVELYFESDGQHGMMRVEKLKDGPPNSVYPFERKVVELDAPDGKPITSVVVVQSDRSAVVKTSKLPKIGTQPRAAYDALLIAMQSGPADLEVGRAAIVETMIEPAAGERDRRNSRAGSLIDDLVNRGLVFRVGKKLSKTQLIVGNDAAF